VRVVIADDSLLIRDGLASLLRDAGVDVVAQTASADDLLFKIASYQPDVAIIDVRMPPTHTDEGLRAAEEIRGADIGILILSQHVGVRIARRLLSESAARIGYLLKDRVPISRTSPPLRRMRKQLVLDPQVVSQLLTKGRSADDPLNLLTPREREVIELVAEGRSNKGIGERLVITERAVQKHVTSIFMKLGLPQSDDDHRRILAVLAYMAPIKT
jgi:DNA-binding NarL/FixJ family response regulator